MKQCELCGQNYLPKRKSKLKTQRFCGRFCSAKWSRSQPDVLRKISEGQKRNYQINPQRAKNSSIRMCKNNPMKNPKTRNKMSKTLKRIGHQPKIRRGNGTGMTKPEKVLMKLF